MFLPRFDVAIGYGLVLILTFPGVTQAASSQASPRPEALARLLECRNLSDGTARLACYDATASTLDTAERDGTVVVVDRAQVRAARRQLFGFDLSTMPSLFERDAHEADISQIDTTLTRAVQLGDQMWVFTLADGTVWRQVDAAPARFQNRHGSTVRIRRASMGSYLLSIGHGGGIRVRRQ